ncbi:peptidoglycan DD-metalloendopeptidase family protein [Rhizobiaceae bacterium]|nr:peptidoglycan DD-metalloendopeptidase family protein [Rhizobiaceae bacterium]
MRPTTTLPHRLRLLRTVTVCATVATLAGCSADAIRFEEALGSSLTTATTMTPNQHRVIHGEPDANDNTLSVGRSGQTAKLPVAASISPAPALPAAAPISVSRAPLSAPLSAALPAATTQNGKPLYVLPPVSETAPTAQTRETFQTASNVQAARPGQLVLAPRSDDTALTGSIASTASDPASTAQPDPAGWNDARTTSVVLKPGETLHNLSRRFGVPVRAITAANGISDASSVAAGTTIQIPTYTYASSAKVSAPDSNPLTKVSRSSNGFQGQARDAVPVPRYRVAAAPTPAAVPSIAEQTSDALAVPQPTGGNFHTVLSGQTLYAVSRKYNVRMESLRVANNLSSDALSVGQKLIIPGEGFTPAQVDTAATASVAPPAAPTDRKVVAAPTMTTAAKTEPAVRTASTAKPAAASSEADFSWPASGTILTRFGAATSTGANDGIDIAVPAGTPVKAARAGTVIYSGSELEDFGKLILLSHAGGFVTAYAHASDVLVKRGQTISAGQVIAKSGATGNATQPKLHFEIRKNSKPVNPLLHLPK